MADSKLIMPSGPVTIDQEPDEFPETGGPCEDCGHAVWDPQGKEPMGSCRIDEPHTQIVLLPPKVQGGMPISIPVSGWPPVRRRQGCAKFALKKSKQQ